MRDAREPFNVESKFESIELELGGCGIAMTESKRKYLFYLFETHAAHRNGNRRIVRCPVQRGHLSYFTFQYFPI